MKVAQFRAPLKHIKIRVGPYLMKEDASNTARTSPRGLPDPSTLNTDRNPPSMPATARKAPKHHIANTPGPIAFDANRSQYSVKWQFFDGEDREHAKMMR